MRKDEALREIALEFEGWPDKPEKPTGTDALVFFGWLQKERPHLLHFKYGGDRWQAVHGYLLHRRLVSD